MPAPVFPKAKRLFRRSILLLPLALAACGGDEEEPAFPPLRYDYLPPIRLNVATITTEQRYVPSGEPPDVSNEDPIPPVEALKTMANDRLQAFGTSNKAVFAILDASLTREGDVVIGSMDVSVSILDDNGTQLGLAEARVQSRHTGQIDSLRTTLYDLTKTMMSDMNVEFEYQIRRNLTNWLTDAAAPAAPVEQTPLNGSPSDQPPLGQPPLGQPPSDQPQYLPPPSDQSQYLQPPPQ